MAPSRAVLCAAAVVVLATAPRLDAQQGTLDKVRETGYLTIGYRDASVPFSYLDGAQRPVGYAVDLCNRVADAVKGALGMPALDVRYQLVTSANRIPLVTNGTVDLECGSTSNTLERQALVSFSYTYFVASATFVSKRPANLASFDSLRGRTVVATAGSITIQRLAALNRQKGLGIRIVSANGHPEAFQMMESGRAAAFAMDDVLLASLVATSRDPGQFTISREALSVEPYAVMMRRGDTAFKKLVDSTLAGLYKSGEAARLYDKWFGRPIPPRNVTLGVPMSAALRRVMAHPTDSGDPRDYE